MHRLIASLFAALITGSLLLSGPASAGGPTSALLSVPGGGRTASLYYTDADYDVLADLLGAGAVDGVGKRDTSGGSHAEGPGVTVTWLIHDVTPWRVDHIYLQGEGAPWISTQVGGPNGEIWDSEVVWHQPADGAALEALLDRLGVGSTSLAGEAEDDAETSAARSVDTAVPSTSASGGLADAETSPYAVIGWVLGGLLLGVLGSVAVQRRSGLTSRA